MSLPVRERFGLRNASRPQRWTRAMSLTSARAHYQEEIARGEECDNCGQASAALACCSRCRSAWFCSVACQRAYWPFHKEWCRRNDFADAVEASEPKFARWMRKHGKQAVLKDGGSSSVVGRGRGRERRERRDERDDETDEFRIRARGTRGTRRRAQTRSIDSIVRW